MIMQAYAEFPTPPHPLHAPEVINDDSCKQHLSGIGVACLIDQTPPPLPITPQMRIDLDIEEVLDIKHGDQDG